MSKTRFVAFATQKGGIGKSTITALVANYFHNVKGYNVAVIDCDEPQYNLADLLLMSSSSSSRRSARNLPFSGRWLTNVNERIYMKCMKECLLLSAIHFSIHDFQTASVSEENCRRIERLCSVPPSSPQTRICCEEVASRNCLTKFVCIPCHKRKTCQRKYLRTTDLSDCPLTEVTADFPLPLQLVCCCPATTYTTSMSS